MRNQKIVDPNEDVVSSQKFHDNKEIERKFLVDYFDYDELEKYNPREVHITQVYLEDINGECERRIRKTVSNEGTQFEITMKSPVSNKEWLTREENTVLLRDIEVFSLISFLSVVPVKKTRVEFSIDEFDFMLDDYDAIDLVILEVETRDTSKEIPLIDGLYLGPEVTNNPSYLTKNIWKNQILKD